MLYLYGANIPAHKKIRHALTSITGIGYQTASDICNQLGFGQEFYVHELTEAQISKICQIIEEKYLIEGDLRKEINLNIQRLVHISCYRGLRHTLGLPLRGQRTHSNGKTQKRLGKRFKK